MRDFPTFTIIINRHAASGRSRNSLKIVTRYLTMKHINFRICSTPPDGAKSLICDLINNHELTHSVPLIMGGDGTLNQAINGIKQSNHPQTALAYIPAGSGNDFANSLHVEPHQEIKTLQKIINTIIPKTINLGQVKINDQTYYFINNLGIGLAANMVHYANQSSLKSILNHLHLSQLIYLSQLTKSIQQEAFSVNLHIGYQDLYFNNIIACVVCNHPFIGSGLKLVPSASLFENNLDIVLVEELSSLQLTNIVYKLLTNGQHLNSPLVHHYQLHQFQLNSRSYQYGQIDGEDLGCHTFDFKISTTKQRFWL